MVEAWQPLSDPEPISGSELARSVNQCAANLAKTGGVIMNQINHECIKGRSVRPVTVGLVRNMLLDLPLSPAQITDFGVDTADKYRALKAVLFNEGDATHVDDDSSDTEEQLWQRIQALDHALGDGRKLNWLIQKYAPEYVSLVQFRTDWDEIL